jgi:hypothetical protein
MRIANYPNPFNPVTTLHYTVASDGPVTLRVFDLLGRTVATPVDGPQAAGMHTVQFNGSGLASGAYVCRLECAGAVVSCRISLLK